MTRLALVLHVAAGVVAILSGMVAMSVRKGGILHRKAGSIFGVSMVVMALFACYLAFVIPDQITNVFISTFSLYLVSTGWLTVKRDAPGLPEKVALLVGICLCAPFLILSFQLVMGLPPLFKSAVPFEGPVLVAVYMITSLLAVAVIGDAKLVFAGGISGVSRISRHLWRMGLGLTLAVGSGFSNGLARLLPGPYHVPTAFFFPKFIPLCLVIYWLIRVRYTNQFTHD